MLTPGEKMGIRIMTTSKGFRVVALTPGSPCELPGAIEVGDYVEQVNAAATHGLKHIEVVQLLRTAGAAGSEFTLTLRREPAGSDDVDDDAAAGGDSSAATAAESAGTGNTRTAAAAASAFYAVVPSEPDAASGLSHAHSNPSLYPTAQQPRPHPPHPPHQHQGNSVPANAGTNAFPNNPPTTSASAPTSPAHPNGLAGPMPGLLRSASTWSTSSIGSGSIVSDDMRDASSPTAVFAPTTPPPTMFGTAATTAGNADTRLTSPLAHAHSSASPKQGGGGETSPLTGWLAAVSSQLSEEQQGQQHALQLQLQQAGTSGGAPASSAVPTRGLKKSGRSSPIEQNAMGSNKFARLLDSTQISVLCTEDELKQLVLHRVKPRRGCRVKRVGGALATAGFKVSDVLVQVGSTVVLGAKPERVVRELRTCHSNGNGRVDVVVATSKEVDMLDCEILESLLVSVRSCTVSRPPGSGIGVSIVSRPNKMGSLVKSVVPDSPFAESQVTKNDMFLRIQGEPVLFLPHDEVARIIRAAGTTIDMSLGRADEVDAVMAELTKLRSKMDAMSHSRSSKAKKSGSGNGSSFMSSILGRLGASSSGDGGGGGGAGAADTTDSSAGAGEGHTGSSPADSQIDDQDSTSGYISSDGSLRTSSSDFLLATPASSLSSILDGVNDTQDWLQDDQFDSGFYSPDIVMQHMDTSFESPDRPQTAAAAATTPPPRRPASAPPTAPPAQVAPNPTTIAVVNGRRRATDTAVAAANARKVASSNTNNSSNSSSSRKTNATSDSSSSSKKLQAPIARRSNSAKSAVPKKKTPSTTPPAPTPTPAPATTKMKKMKSSRHSAHSRRNGKEPAPFREPGAKATESPVDAVDVQAAADVAFAEMHGGVVMRGGAMAAAELTEFKATERSLFAYLEDKASSDKGVHTMSSEEYRAYCDLLTDGSITSSNYGSDDEDGDVRSNARLKRTRVNSTMQQVVPLWTSAMTDLREWLRENWAAAAAVSSHPTPSSASVAPSDGPSGRGKCKGKGKGKGKSSIPVKGKGSQMHAVSAAALAAAATLDDDDASDGGTFKMFKYKIFLAQLAAAKKRREEAEVLCSASVSGLEGNLTRLFGAVPACLHDAYGHEAASSSAIASSSASSSSYSPASSVQTSRSASPAFGSFRTQKNDGDSSASGGSYGAGSAESIVLRTSAIPRAAGTSQTDDPSAVGTALCKAVVSQLSRVEADRVKIFERQEAVHQLQDTALVATHGVEVHFATVEDHSGIDFKIDHRCPYGLEGLQFVQNRDSLDNVGSGSTETGGADGGDSEDDHTGKYVLTINGMFALGLDPEEAKVLLKVTKQHVLSLTLLPREELWAAAQMDWNLFNPYTNGWIPPPPASFDAIFGNDVEDRAQDRRGPYRNWLGGRMAATNPAREFGTRPPLLARHSVLHALPDSVTGRRRTLSLSSNGGVGGASQPDRGRGQGSSGRGNGCRSSQGSERMVDELLMRVGEATKDTLEDVLKEAAARSPTVLQEMLTKMSGQGDINRDVLNGAMSAAVSHAAAATGNPATAPASSLSPFSSVGHASIATPEQPVVYKWQSGRNMTAQIEARRAQLLALDIDQDSALVAEWMALLRVRATLTSFQDFQSAAEKSESWFKKTSVKSLLARFRSSSAAGGDDKGGAKTTRAVPHAAADSPRGSTGGKVWVGLASNNDSGICIEDNLPIVPPPPSFTPPSSPQRQVLTESMQHQRSVHTRDFDPYATPTRPRHEQELNARFEHNRHNDATPVSKGIGIGEYTMPCESASSPFASPPVQASTPDAATRARARARAEIARRRAIQTESVLV